MMNQTLSSLVRKSENLKRFAEEIAWVAGPNRLESMILFRNKV